MCRVVIPETHPLNVTVALRSAIERLAPQVTLQRKSRPKLTVYQQIGGLPEVCELGSQISQQIEEYFDSSNQIECENNESRTSPIFQSDGSEDEVLQETTVQSEEYNQPNPLIQPRFHGLILGDLLSQHSQSQSDSSVFYLENIQSDYQYSSNLLFPHMIVESPTFIPKSAMSLLLRRSGIYAEIPDALHLLSTRYYEFTRTIVEDLFWITLNNMDKDQSLLSLLRTEDLLTILKPKSCLVYGYGGVRGINYVWIESICDVFTQIHPHMFLSPSAVTVLHDAIADVFDTVLTSSLTHVSNISKSSKYGGMDHNHRNIINIPLLKQKPCDHATHIQAPVAVQGGNENIRDRIVTCSDIQRILILIFRDDVFSHCMKDIQTTLDHVSALVDRVPEDEECGFDLLCEYQNNSKLTFSIHVTIYLAFSLYGVILTFPAACYLTMLCEYISAEVLELAGYRANETGNECVLGSHVHHAICNDSELIQSCPGAIKHHQIMTPLNSRVDDPALRNYHILRDTLLASAPYGIMIDPLTGCHISSSYKTCHHLDIACSIKLASERARLAYDLCPPDQQKIIDAYRKNTLRIRRDYIYAAQSYATLPLIPMETYISIISDITGTCRGKLLEILHPDGTLPVWNIFWTMEILVLLQLSVEKYFLMKLEILPSLLMKNPNWNGIVTDKDLREVLGKDN